MGCVIVSQSQRQYSGEGSRDKMAACRGSARARERCLGWGLVASPTSSKSWSEGSGQCHGPGVSTPPSPRHLARPTGRMTVGPGKESSGCRCPLRPERPVPGGPPPSPRLKTGEGEGPPARPCEGGSRRGSFRGGSRQEAPNLAGDEAEALGNPRGGQEDRFQQQQPRGTPTR